jgi:hypothetical protein
MERFAIITMLWLVLAGCGRSTPATGSPAARAPVVPGVRGQAPLIEPAVSQEAPTRILDPRADELLREMSGLLAATPRFAFEAEESFDEVQSGQPRMRLSNQRRVAVERPDRFATDAEGDSMSRSVWFDGGAIAAYDRAHHAYATLPAPGSIDAALDMLLEKYRIDVPLADLLYSDPYQVLTADATYSRYLGIHRAAGVACHHLVIAQEDIEWQIWIDAGGPPLPRQIVITYVREPGEPQYLAAITRWRLLPAFPDGLFRFEAPDGAERVDASAFIPRVPGSLP